MDLGTGLTTLTMDAGKYLFGIEKKTERGAPKLLH